MRWRRCDDFFRLALALLAALALAALWREGGALSLVAAGGDKLVPRARECSDNVRLRECSAAEAAFQGENLDIALIRGCPPRDDVWIRQVQLHMPHARTFLDIGSNKGYTGARFFSLWNPELGMTPQELERHNRASSNLSEFTSCGHCNDCRLMEPQLVDAHERLCGPGRATSQVQSSLAAIRAAQARVCAARRKSLRPIRVLSFDGNVRLVEALRRSIAHRASSSAAALAVFKALYEVLDVRQTADLSETTQLAAIGLAPGTRRAALVRRVQDALGLLEPEALSLGDDASTVRDLVRALEGMLLVSTANAQAISETAAIVARQWSVELRALTPSCAPGETINFVLDGEMGHIVDERKEAAKEAQDVRNDRVPCITVDQVLQREGWLEIDVLKIDAEGHDLGVLDGAAGALKGQRVALILFEYNTFWPTLPERSLQHTVRWLQNMGYVCYFEGKNVLARLTACWHQALGEPTWRNVYCLSLKHLPGLVHVFDAKSLAFFAHA